jgi:hypothetical protein
MAEAQLCARIAILIPTGRRRRNLRCANAQLGCADPGESGAVIRVRFGHLTGDSPLARTARSGGSPQPSTEHFRDPLR